MDLLGVEEKKQKNTGKNIVLALLILSIILLILLMYFMTILSEKQTADKFSIYINNEQINTADVVITDENGNKFITIKELSNKLGEYTYYSSKYGSIVEDKSKCYLESKDEIIGFEAGSNKIYKTIPKDIIGYQNIELKTNIANTENRLYISIEDIEKAFDVKYSNKNGVVKIYTPEFLVEQYKVEFEAKEDKTYQVISSYDNNKSIIEDMLVVSENGKFGVIDITNMETKIGSRYNKMIFNTHNKGFIVTTENNKIGVIDKNGAVKIEPQYDSLRIINYLPMLYEVKANGKVGIIKEDGKILLDIQYDRLGCEGDVAKNTKSVLIIPDIQENENGIVVSSNSKYGIINMSTGELIGECNLDKVYSKVSQITNEVEYFVEINDNIIELEKYISHYMDKKSV